MGGGPDSVTSTTSSEPPGFLLGPLTTAANAAQRDFGAQTGQAVSVGNNFGNGFSGFGGNGISPFAFPSQLPPDQSRGPNVDPVGSGNRLIGQSQDLVSQSLAGDFLTPDSNPFLQDTFNRAADLTRTRLSSEFAGSGRNLGAALPARSEELQTLASNIFGGNFQRERDRQTSAIDQAQGLDPINQLINRLAGIIPGAGGSTQSTQPVFRTGLF